MSVWQVWDRLSDAQGGLAVACARLANSLVAGGASVSAISFDPTAAALPQLDARVVRTSCRDSWPGRLGYSRSLGRTLAAIAPPDVVHIHGLWRMHFAQAAGFAHRHHIPTILTVHGMLHRHALAQRRALKLLAGPLFQSAVIARARCLHATSEQELEEVRRGGYAGPVAVIPWGVDEPAGRFASTVGRAAAGPPRRVLFLGRLHPGKGVDGLVRAFARVAARHPDWRLVIAGFDEHHYGAMLRTLAGELGIAASIEWAGAVGGTAREQLFADAALVVLPSAAENFGFVVAEALVRGVPVIATHGAPWAILARERCGWWIPAADDALAGALEEALARSPEELERMGARGRAYALEHLTWAGAAGQMLAVYEWARAGGPAPAFVDN